MLDNYASGEQEHIAENIATVRANITVAAQRAGRDPAEITLVAVSKTWPVTLVQVAYSLGITHFGENRVQEALPKIAEFRPPHLTWHMIGHVQSNKAHKVVSSFDFIQSVDSLPLAQALDHYAGIEHKQRLPILLEVNVSGEQNKAGMAITQVIDLARQIATLPHLEIQGLMTVAPQTADLEEVRPVFRALRMLKDNLRNEIPHCSHLSMGMTNDYSVAIEEGATIVRIGRAIFGKRVYKGDPL